MFCQNTIKQSSKLLPTSSSLQNIMVDLEPQHEESISGGTLPMAVIFIVAIPQSSKTQLGK